MYELIMPPSVSSPRSACPRELCLRNRGRNPPGSPVFVRALVDPGHDGYLIVPEASISEEDQVYFTDLGPAQDYWREEPSGVVWRRFQRGVAAVNAGGRLASIPSLGLSLPEPMQGYFFPDKA